MKHLIIIAHGSRRERSNEYFVDLVQKLEPLLTTHYDALHACFLEMAKPDLEHTIGQAAKSGASQIDVFPYFLGPGNHVLEDIPKLLKQVQKHHPHCSLRQLDFFGANEHIENFLLTAVTTALEKQHRDTRPHKITSS